MKPLPEQDHYEVLEVSRNSSPESIERAYRLAQATYAEDSLAGYSMFGDDGAREIRQRVETAYRVLTNHESRRAYAEAAIHRFRKSRSSSGGEIRRSAAVGRGSRRTRTPRPRSPRARKASSSVKSSPR